MIHLIQQSDFVGLVFNLMVKDHQSRNDYD